MEVGPPSGDALLRGWRLLLRGNLLPGGSFLLRGRSGRRFLRRRLHGRGRPRTPLAFAVQVTVVLGGAEDPLHVVLRLGKRDVVDELVLVHAGTFRLPPDDPVL